jgi:hypothetical protein
VRVSGVGRKGEVRLGFGHGGMSAPSPPPPIFIEYANGPSGHRPISNANLYGWPLIQIVMIVSWAHHQHSQVLVDDDCAYIIEEYRSQIQEH